MMHQGVAVPDLQESALGIPLTSLCRAVQLGDLYENDSIFDKFDCCFSGDGTQVATGTYSNCFRVVSRGDSRSGAPGTDQVLEASRDPQRKRLQQTPAKVELPKPRLPQTGWCCGLQCCRLMYMFQKQAEHLICQLRIPCSQNSMLTRASARGIA